MEIPLSVPHLNGNEWKYVKECLDSNWVSYLGPFVQRFESDLATAVGASYAVAMCSGTAALHIALLLTGVAPDDEVLMPAMSFVAPANAVRYCGAWPTFTDIRRDDWQWDVDQVRTFLSVGCELCDGKLTNKQTGRRVAALLPVHLLGGMCDVDGVAQLATDYGLPLVEDAAECLGALYKDRPIAAPCPAYRGPMRIVVTSFNCNKNITTGGGGALFVEAPELAARAKHLSTTAKADPVDFFHDEVGYNYRLTNMAAALGVAQLQRLDEHVFAKRRIAERYTSAFAATSGVRAHPSSRDVMGTYWMYTVTLRNPSRPVTRELNDEGVGVRPVWQPLPRLPAFKAAHVAGTTPAADALHDYALSLPCSVGLTPHEQDHVLAMVLQHCGCKGE